MAMTVMNPVATPAGDQERETQFPIADRPESLDGRTIGFFWNGKSHGEIALQHAAQALDKVVNGATYLHYLGDRGAMMRFATLELRDKIVRECDVVVGASADCGSCTSFLMRDLAAFERLGVPTVALVADEFAEDARFSAGIFGCPDLSTAIVPLPFTNRDPLQIAQMVDDVLDDLVAALTQAHRPVDFADLPTLQLESRPELDYDGADLLEAFDRMQDDFIRRGWSDGMPLVPPTRQKVERMVAAAGRPADEVIGIFDPGRGIGTVEKIAVNAVMAGARPEAMPVILAVAEAVLDPVIGLRTWAMSTGPQAPIIMVSGPMAAEIGMNSGICALGPGSVSSVNVAIGRTLRLVMMNVGHCYPGISDMDTIGTPMKFSACVAENEGRNPWLPFRVEQGFAVDDTTVTVNVPYGMTELFDFENHDPDLLVEAYATVSRGVIGSPNPGVWLIKNNSEMGAGYPFNGLFKNLILMCPEHAQAFATAGWSTRDIKEALHRASRRPFREAMINKGIPLFEAAHPELQWLLDHPETDVSLFPSADCFEIFVVGGDAGRSLYCFGGTTSVTKAVRRA